MPEISRDNFITHTWSLVNDDMFYGTSLVCKECKTRGWQAFPRSQYESIKFFSSDGNVICNQAMMKNILK